MSERRPSKRRETGRRPWVWLAIGLVLGTTVGGSIVGVGADLIGKQNVEVSEEPGQIYHLDVSEARYMNRIYSERSHEIAYCVLHQRQRMQVWMADTVTSHTDRVEFSIANCPNTGRTGTAHTHPGGNPRLSDTDKRTLYESDETLTCIQAGQIDTTVGARATNFQCYREAENDSDAELVRSPVVIVDVAGSDRGS